MRMQVQSIVVIGVTAWFMLAACGDSNDSPGDGGTTGDSGGEMKPATSKCATKTPCTSDTQCVALGGSSCNTRANLCQTVLCGGEGEDCSADEQCKKGFVCSNNRCKYDPTPRCYHPTQKSCIEGEFDRDWMKECELDGGEIVSSCPKGRLAVCRYMEDDKPIALSAYRESDVDDLSMACSLLKGKMSYGSE